MPFWNRCKPLSTSARQSDSQQLKRTLTGRHLITMGVGAIVGTGIYTLTGIGAGLAGPGVILSFLLCGVICTCAALCYAEMATLIPTAGSAYTYTYSVLGELLAWIVGWSLILEYTVAASAVAVGWSGYVSAFIHTAGWAVPDWLLHGAMSGGVIDLPAVLITMVVAGLLIVGTRESAFVTMLLVAIKLLALLLFVVLALRGFNAANFHPFLPFGISVRVGADGVKRGVLAAAALIFFAFYGFDAVSTAAEETKNPSRDLKVGILGSMALSTTIYILVALAALGASYYSVFSRSSAPLSFILNTLHNPFAAQLVSAAAIIALPSVVVVLMYGQSRIFFAMARDGLLPHRLSVVHADSGTPILMTIVTGVIVAVLAGTLRLDEIALLANAGTLCAFIAVAFCVLVVRLRNHRLLGSFRTPLPWVVAPFCIVGCGYLFVTGLPNITQLWFVSWNAIGLVIYFAYSVRTSLLARQTIPAPAAGEG